MADPLHPTNSIEVNLKILEDKNLDRLDEFAKDWSKSVEILRSAIGDLKDAFDQQSPGVQEGTRAPLPDPLEGRHPLNSAGAVSAAASMPGVGEAGEVSEGATGIIPVVRIAGTPGVSPSASVAQESGAPAISEEEQRKKDIDARNTARNPYLEAQFELGDVGQGPLAVGRYFSRLLQQWGPTEGLGTKLEGYTKLATIGKGAVGGLYENAARWMGLPSARSFMPGTGSNEAMQFGIQSGRSPSGGAPFGQDWLKDIPVVGSLINLFSPAGQSGMEAELKSKWEGIRSSLFGGSDITGAQSLAIKENLAEYGYNDPGMEAQHSYLQNMMTHFTKQYRGAITPEDMQELGGDAATRYGIGNLTTLNQMLGDLGTNAKDAGYSLEVFKESVKKAVLELQGTTPPATAAQQASNWSRDTGFLPEQYGQIAGDYKNQIVGMAETHTDPYHATHGAKSGEAAMLGYQRLLGAAGDPRNYQGMKKGDARYAQMFDMIYWRNGGKPPEGFTSIDAFMKYMMQGGEKHVIKENQAMSALTHAHSAKDIEHWMKEGGASKARVQEFEAYREKLLHHYMQADHTKGHPTNPKAYAAWMAKNDPKQYNEFLHKEKMESLTLMNKAIQHHTTKQTAQNISVSLDLTQQAKELVKKMNQQNGGKGHSNSFWNNYGRPALGTGERVAGDVLNPIHGIPDAVGAIKSIF